MDASKIILADNDDHYRQRIQNRLIEEGFRVLIATNPSETRWAMSQPGIKLAILDNRLIDDESRIDTSGLELARDPTFKHIPKIIIDRYIRLSSIREILSYRGNEPPPALDFLDKTSEEELIEAVHLILRSGQMKIRI